MRDSVFGLMWVVLLVGGTLAYAYANQITWLVVLCVLVLMIESHLVGINFGMYTTMNRIREVLSKSDGHEIDG